MKRVNHCRTLSANNTISTGFPERPPERVCQEQRRSFEDSESLHKNPIKILYKQKDLSMTVNVDSVIPTMVFPICPKTVHAHMSWNG
jgi:hypothetical protein